MTTTLILLAIATAVATFCGGYFALRFKDKSHLILGFSAGAVIGVAFFDLLPEAIDTGSFYDPHTIIAVAAIGFISYLVFDRLFHVHAQKYSQQNHLDHDHENHARGTLRASSLSVHSFLDGIGIGLAFQISSTLGFVVAFAVLAHDFSDGINTVSAIMKGGGTIKKAFRWLLVDALAPVLGIIITTFFSLPNATFGIILALFAGFFLYIGASDLIPESYHAHPTKWTTIATILGAALIYVVIHFAN